MERRGGGHIKTVVRALLGQSPQDERLTYDPWVEPAVPVREAKVNTNTCVLGWASGWSWSPGYVAGVEGCRSQTTQLLGWSIKELHFYREGRGSPLKSLKRFFCRLHRFRSVTLELLSKRDRKGTRGKQGGGC